MPICTKHNIEHSENLPCDLFERYSQLSGVARSVTAFETKEIEDSDGKLIGMERVEVGTYASGYVGPAKPCCAAPGDEHEPHCVMFKRG